MGKNNMKGQIISAFIGATFFAVPYLGMGISVLPSLGIGAIAYGAGTLMFSDSKKEEPEDKAVTFKKTILDARKQNAQIYAMISKIDNPQMIDNLEKIHDTAKKIIDTVEKKKDTLNKAQSFFDYFLPVTVKILKKYDDIENQGLDSEEVKKFMKSTENMIEKIEKSFKEQLSKLYQADIIDTDAEMKVFDAMLSSEGFDNINDFKINK